MWSDAARQAAREARRRRAKAGLRAGDVVRYSHPGPGERGYRFKVLEAHGGAQGRVHAQMMNGGAENWRVKPVETVRPSELRRTRATLAARHARAVALLRQRAAMRAQRRSGQLFGIPGKFYRKGG